MHAECSWGRRQRRKQLLPNLEDETRKQRSLVALLMLDIGADFPLGPNRVFFIVSFPRIDSKPSPSLSRCSRTRYDSRSP